MVYLNSKGNLMLMIARSLVTRRAFPKAALYFLSAESMIPVFDARRETTSFCVVKVCLPEDSVAQLCAEYRVAVIEYAVRRVDEIRQHIRRFVVPCVLDLESRVIVKRGRRFSAIHMPSPRVSLMPFRCRRSSSGMPNSSQPSIREQSSAWFSSHFG